MSPTSSSPSFRSSESKVVPSSIAHTAIDALNAKLSALSVGYQPITSKREVYYTALRIIASYCCNRNHENIDGSTNANRNFRDICKKDENIVKRQCPLVNSGYAARMSIVTSVVERFVLYHLSPSSSCKTDNKNTRINVVLLGGGLDALGIWSGCLHDEDGNVNNRVHVYDVDCAKNCKLKMNALHNAGIFQSCGETVLGDVISHGHVCVKTLLRNVNEDSPTREKGLCPKINYTFVTADLSDVTTLREKLNAAMLDWSLPTIVVSELVLAYLGSKAVNELLKFFSSMLSKYIKNNAFFMYEPMSRNGRFVKRLNRCYSKHGEKSAVSNPSFEPIGLDCASTQRRLELCGFRNVATLSAGAALSSICDTDVSSKIPELFDEHIELTMHLLSYSVTLAWTTTKEEISLRKNSHVQELPLFYPSPLRRKCTSKNAIGRIYAVRGEITGYKKLPGDLFVDINPVASLRNDPDYFHYEEQIRSLYFETHESLFQEYPSVKKMVLSSLKIDLGDRRKNVRAPTTCALGIGSYYRDIWNGDFWFATIPSSSTSTDTKVATVVGCVGVRRHGTDSEIDDKNLSNSGTATFEILRLAVAKSHRGVGVGHILVNIVKEHCKIAVATDDTDVEVVRVTATTPVLLNDANNLYAKCGFAIQEDRIMGKLCMRTYVATLQL